MREVQKPVLESREGLDALREHLLYPYILEVRFWSRVRKIGGRDCCWQYETRTGIPSADGYGHVTMSTPGSTSPAHRLSWSLSYGPIPENLYVCHACNNKACVRPGHLYVGTQRVNTRDAIRDGLIPQNARCKFNLRTVRSIRRRAGALYEKGLLGPGAPKMPSAERILVRRIMKETGASQGAILNTIRGRSYQDDILADGPPSRRAYPGRTGLIWWPEKTRLV